MPTNLAIDDKLLGHALRIGGKKTKKDTVNEALQEYVRRRQQKKVLSLFGSLQDPKPYSPKQFRRKSG